MIKLSLTSSYKEALSSSSLSLPRFSEIGFNLSLLSSLSAPWTKS